MKKLLSFVAVLAMALVVAAPTAAKAATWYLDASAAGWDKAAVWCWSEEDPDFQAGVVGAGPAWPGLALEKDATTGYFVVNTDYAEIPSDAAIMFNSNDDANMQQTNDDAAKAAVEGKVCVLTTQDDEGKWNAEWQDVAAPADQPAEPADQPAEPADQPAEPADQPAEPADQPDDPAPVTPETGKDAEPAKTADVAPIAAVSVLAIASMAVVVATKKKMA